MVCRKVQSREQSLEGKFPAWDPGRLTFYSGNTCPGEQVLADSGKIVFLVGPCQLVLKRHFGIPLDCGYLYLHRKKEQENHSKKRSWRGSRLAIIRPWVTNKSTTSDRQINPEIPLPISSLKEQRNFCARGTIHECE